MTIGTRTALLLAALFLGLALSASSGSAFGFVGNISAGLGKKWRSEPSFPRPVREGGAWEPKVDAMLGSRSLPIVLEGYVSRTRQDGRPDTDNDVLLQETRTEVGFGLAGIWRVGPISSHAGGGIAEISSRTKQLYSLEPKEGSFTRTGHWIGVGAFLPLVAGFNVGAIGRYTNVDANPERKHDELGGLSASAVIGWGSLISR